MTRLPPRTLRGQLTAGLVALLAVACLAVGITTALALRGFLMGRLDEQLSASGGRFAASLEHEAKPDADNRPDTRGQADATFGARLLDNTVTQAAVVDDATDRPLHLTPEDHRTLAGIPVDGSGHSIRLSGLGKYRVTAVRGDDQDTLITGLPLHPVEETVHRLEAVEAVLFGAALVATGIAGPCGCGSPCAPSRRSPPVRRRSSNCRWPAARSPCPDRSPTPTPVPRWARSAPPSTTCSATSKMP